MLFRSGQTGAEKADGEAGNIIASNKILSLRTVAVLDAAGNLVQNYNESTSTEELLKKCECQPKSEPLAHEFLSHSCS